MSDDTAPFARELWSSDARFGVSIEPAVLEAMVTACSAAGRTETGGILIGRYRATHDCAIVTEATGPGGGARRGANWFERGVGYLQMKLAELWCGASGFYLGEWHFHPGASPEPSSVDCETMLSIARSPRYGCPEPVLIIIGGQPPERWSMSAAVFLKDGGVIRLRLRGSTQAG